MDYEKGKISAWFNDKGYGFIRPDTGGADVFLHVKEIAPHQRRPRIGDPVHYALIGSETDKPRAARVEIAGFAWSSFSLLCVGLFVVLCVYAVCVWRQVLPFYPVMSAYLTMSLITVTAYHHDKRSALAGNRRTPEAQLHALELLGGWPGALLAQLSLRHKLKKPSYLIAFWLIVLTHAALWCGYGAGLRLPDFSRTAVIASSSTSFTPPRQSASGVQIQTTRPSENMHGRQVPQSNDWADDTPTEPPLDEPRVRRTRVTADSRCRQAVGVVNAVSRSKGVRVTLPPEIGDAGVIHPNTLVSDFYRRFRIGEHIHVGVSGISMSGSQQTINLLLVEHPPRATNDL